MPGWVGPFSTNLDMRRFADKTIRQEIPSHLLGKICWVGNDGFAENICDPVISDITSLIMKKGLTENGNRPVEDEACTCSSALYSLFSLLSEIGMKTKRLPTSIRMPLKTAIQLNE